MRYTHVAQTPRALLPATTIDSPAQEYEGGIKTPAGTADVSHRVLQLGTDMPLPPNTERLMFRTWDAADLEAFQTLCADPVVMRYVGNGLPWTLDQTKQWIDRAIEMSSHNGFCQWALIDKQTTDLIGFCGFVPANDGAEIGWRLAKSHWRKGLATEAASAVLNYGFKNLAFDRVIATVQSPNVASARLCEKLGMQPVSRFRRLDRELIVYSIAKDRLKAAKGEHTLP